MAVRKTAFINAAESPEEELVKDVYAHFGLCIYLTQVFETGLINDLELWQGQFDAIDARVSKIRDLAHLRPTLGGRCGGYLPTAATPLGGTRP
jgi:hypothetical protein